MTAQRVVTDHLELDNIGQLSHGEIDFYLQHVPTIIVSASLPRVPPACRVLIAGDGITIDDQGPGQSLVISSTATASYQISGSGVTAAQHELLPQLIHFADVDGPRGLQWPSGCFRTQGPRPFPTASIWWTDATMTMKIVEQLVVRNAQQCIVTSSWVAYASDGTTPVDSFTDLITYCGVFETSRTRITP